MSLILVVDPDSRHAAQVASMARKHLKAEFVTADSGFRALEVLADRVPDIVLTAPLLPGRDEAVLSDYLRGLGDAGAHVQTLTIPILSAASAPQHSIRGRFRRADRSTAASDGCDPEVFAQQVSQYLQRANQSRRVIEVEPPLAVVESESDIAFTHEGSVDEEVGDDIDLTPFLADVVGPAASDPPPPARPVAPLALSRATLPSRPAPVAPSRATPLPPAASVAPPRVTPPPPPAPVALSRVTPPAPLARVIEPEVVETEPEPPVRAKAPTRRVGSTDIARVGGEPAVIEGEPADRQPPADPPAPTQHLITLPAMIGDGQPGYASGTVSVAVAVSVQVATSAAPAAPAAKRRGKPRPVQDEWGFFDPDQCGFRALLARLDAIETIEDE